MRRQLERGNSRQEAFLLDKDRRPHIDLLRAKSQQRNLAIPGYCLISHHSRLVAISRRPASLAPAIGNASQHFRSKAVAHAAGAL